MSRPSTPAGVTTDLDEDSARATVVIDASPSEVFEFIRRPQNHSEISGDRSVRGNISGPAELGPDSTFKMRMNVGLPYRIRSRVVEFDQDRVIAWHHFGRHRWRWELEPAAGGKTTLTETFDQSTARSPLLLRLAGYPKRHLTNVARSVANVAAHFAQP